jgi:ABC-type branched-subunit amino acid transport system substrate-binding protein
MTFMSFVVTAVFLAVAPAARAETGVSEHEIVIGSCSDMSSPGGVRGRLQSQGAQAYFDYVNSKGGIHGRKIKFLNYDDRYDPEKTIQCFNRLVGEGMFAGAAFLGSASAAKVLPMAETQKIPVVGIAAGPAFLYDSTHHYVFIVRQSYERQVEELISGVWNELGMRRVAVIYQSDAFGAAGLESARKALEARGAKIAGAATFPKDSTDFDEAIATVRAANPDMVVLAVIGGPVVEIVKRSHAAGWHPLFSTLTIDPAVYKAEGTVIAQLVPPFDDDRIPAAALYRRLLKKFPNSEPPGYIGLEGFLDAAIVVEGLKRAGKQPTREGFIKALETIKNLDLGLGPGGRVSYGPDDHVALRRPFFTVVRNGKPVPLRDWKALKSRPGPSRRH